MRIDQAKDRGRSEVLGDLIARKKWRPAIELLREQILSGAAPSIDGRLQLVDLMLLAGRGREAVPVLLGLADEFASNGYVAKSVAILKRVEKLDPECAAVSERLSSLAHDQIRLAPSARSPGRWAPLVDASANHDQTAGVANKLKGAMRRFVAMISSAPTTDAPTAESPPDLPETKSYETTESGSSAADAVLASSAPAISVSDASRSRDDIPLDELLQRLSPDQTLPPIPLKVLLGETPPESGTTEQTDTALEEIIRRLSPNETLPPTPLSALGLDELATAAFTTAAVAEELEPNADEASESEPLSDEAFDRQVLDLVSDVLQRPPAALTTERLQFRDALLASRFLAAPLFVTLSAEELLAVVHGLALRTFAPGEALITEGEQSSSIFILASGQAKVFVRSRDGHAMLVDEFDEGDFFGEIAALSGKRRSATVTAATRCEALELNRATLDSIALAHPRVREALEDAFVVHLGNPDARAVRSVCLGQGSQAHSDIDVLAAHFGEGRWRPRMRLHLAEALIRSGKHDYALPILVGLAGELARNGYPEKAIALVKKVEQIQKRHVAEIPLAPLRRAASNAEASAARSADGAGKIEKASSAKQLPFEQWLLRLAREAVEKRQAREDGVVAQAPPLGYAPNLRASPLFEEMGERELTAIIEGLRLVHTGAGDIIVSEGEPGHSVFVLVSGSVRILVRDAQGRNVTVCNLDEGSFFGEISTLSGRLRSATVVAAAACELLEIEKTRLDQIAESHPRVREALERVYIERAIDPRAARIRAVDA